MSRSNYGDNIDWAYECIRDCGIDDQFALEEEQQQNDPDYEVISIDYSNKSFEQFQADLLDPASELVKELEKIGLPPV